MRWDVKVGDPRGGWWWVGGVTTAVAMVVGIVGLQLRGPQAHFMDADYGPLALAPGKGCTTKQLRGVCRDIAAAGWPSCHVWSDTDPGPYVIVSVNEALSNEGLTGRYGIDTRTQQRYLEVDTCDPQQLTAQHEVLHGVYRLADDGMTGSIMCSHEAPLEAPKPNGESIDLGGVGGSFVKTCIGNRYAKPPKDWRSPW